MGSHVSATVAKLYMEFFEDLALSTAPMKPWLWKRYVDDTCCIVKKAIVEALLDNLNSARPSIKFTVEIEKDGALPFLDTLHQRKDNGSLKSRSTGSPPTQTSTWTTGPTIPPTSRGVWSGACMGCHRHPGWPAGGRTPPVGHPEVERLPSSFHPLFHPATSPTHGGPPGAITWGGGQATPGDATIHSRGQWRHKANLQEVYTASESSSDLDVHTTQCRSKWRTPASGEAVQGGVQDSLQLWQGLHWGDQEETYDQTEGAPGCLPERDDDEVNSRRARLQGSPLHQMGRDHSDGQGQTP